MPAAAEQLIDSRAATDRKPDASQSLPQASDTTIKTSVPPTNTQVPTTTGTNVSTQSNSALNITPAETAAPEVVVLVQDISKQLLDQITPLVARSFSSNSEVFDLIKEVIKKQTEAMLLDQSPGVSDSNNSLDAKKLDQKEQGAVADPVETLKKGSVKKNAEPAARTNSSSVKDLETIRLSRQSNETAQLSSLQFAVTQLCSATDTISKISMARMPNGDSVYVLLPLLIAQNLKSAELTLHMATDPEHRERQKKRPKRLKIKMELPLFGEVVIELLSSGHEVEVHIFVASAKAKEELMAAQHILMQAFTEHGIRPKTCAIFIAKVPREIPAWLTHELGVQSVA